MLTDSILFIENQYVIPTTLHNRSFKPAVGFRSWLPS